LFKSKSGLKDAELGFPADELVGDIMDYSLQARESIVTWEPLRKVLDPPPNGPGRVRIGPDWTALAGNWFTRWERTVCRISFPFHESLVLKNLADGVRVS
jgi:hypothetical protein